MGARAGIIRHKLRFVVIGLILLAVGSLVLFSLLNLSFGNKSGNFERTTMKYELVPELSADDIRALEIQATNIHLEVGMASNIHRVQIGMYGKDYTNQKVTVHIADGRMVVSYPSMAMKMPKDLTLRVMIPQTSLRQVLIKGEHLPVHLSQLRTDMLSLKNKRGALEFDEVNANSMDVFSERGNIRAEDNYVTQVHIQTNEGKTTLRNNKTKLCYLQSEQGDIQLYDGNWHGQIFADTLRGDITAVSRHRPWSLMVQAQSAGGDVRVLYDKGRWKRPNMIKSGKEQWIGSVGNNPANGLTLTSEEGHITVAQRGRYTDTFAS